MAIQSDSANATVRKPAHWVKHAKKIRTLKSPPNIERNLDISFQIELKTSISKQSAYFIKFGKNGLNALITSDGIISANKIAPVLITLQTFSSASLS